MNRRSLLKAGMGAGGAGVAVAPAGCAHLSGAPGEDAQARVDAIDESAVNQLVAAIDRRLLWIDRHRGLDDLVPAEKLARSPHADLAARRERLFRKSMRTLYLTGRFIDLPPEVQAHPEVQARVWRAQGDMDEAVVETTAMLANLDGPFLRRMQAVLRERPQLPERLAKLADRPAAEDGIPLGRRLKLRAGVLQLAQRMRDQSPALVIDPIVRKARRIAELPNNAGDAGRIAAARLGQRAFWEHQTRMQAYARAWQARQGTPAAGSQTLPRRPEAPAAPPAGPVEQAEPKGGRKILRVGGKTMGFGAASVGAGLLFAGLAHVTTVDAFLVPAVVLGITVGPILLAVGLLVVLVGALVYAAE